MGRIGQAPSAYQRWETLLDSSSFISTEFLSLVVRKVAIMHPAAVGSLISAAGHAFSIALAKKTLGANNQDSQVLQAAATVIGLACSVIALPYLVSKFAIHTVVRLNFETALRTAFVSLALKTTAYGLYRIGSGILDRFAWNIPQQIEDIELLKLAQRTRIQAYFQSHMNKKRELSLRFQFALDLPIGPCPSIGEGWTREELVRLRCKNLSFLTTGQSRKLQAHFLEHDVLPQNRIYESKEMPALPAITDMLSPQKLQWVHLILRLTNAPVNSKLPEQFYKQGLPPVRDESFAVPLPDDLAAAKPFELAWIRNYFCANQNEWKQLPFKEQQGFNAKFGNPLPLYPKSREEIAALTQADLCYYSKKFQTDPTLQGKFSIQMRRALASRVEKELHLSAAPFFKSGESRAYPNLTGRVTKNNTGKQVLTIAMIGMLFLVPTVSVLGSLFPSHSFPAQLISDPCTEGKFQEKNEITREFTLISSHFDEFVASSKFGSSCPDQNCLMVSEGSHVINHPMEDPKYRRVAIKIHKLQKPDHLEQPISQETCLMTQPLLDPQLLVSYNATSTASEKKLAPIFSKLTDADEVCETFLVGNVQDTKPFSQAQEYYIAQVDPPQQLTLSSTTLYGEGQYNLSRIHHAAATLVALIGAAVVSNLRLEFILRIFRGFSLSSLSFYFEKGALTLPFSKNLEKLSEPLSDNEQSTLQTQVNIFGKGKPDLTSRKVEVWQKSKGKEDYLADDCQARVLGVYKEQEAQALNAKRSQKIPFQEKVKDKKEMMLDEWEVIEDTSSLKAPPAFSSASALRASWVSYLGENGHPAKIRKYRVILDEYLRIIQDYFQRDPQSVLKQTEKLAKKHLESQMFQDLNRAMEALIYPMDPKKEYFDARTQKALFVQKLRKVITSPDYQSFHLKERKVLSADQIACRDIVWMLSDMIFRPEIFSYIKDTTDLFTQANTHETGEKLNLIPKINKQNLEQIIAQKNSQVKAAPKEVLGKSKTALAYQKLCGALGRKDFIGTENVPFVRNKYVVKNEVGKERVIDFCRHGCPVTEGSIWRIGIGMPSRLATKALGCDLSIRSGEAVAPEYDEMLFAMASRGEGDFYVNHQRRIPGGVENERDRVEVIEKLQVKHENEYVLTQSVEGSLFMREGSYANITTFEELIAAIIETFNQKDDVRKGFYAQNMLPQIFWENEAYKKQYMNTLQQLLHFVHKHFFDSREDINFKGVNPVDKSEAYQLREWQAFIEIFYALQTVDMMFNLSSFKTKSGKTYTIKRIKKICKDMLDRGGDQAKNLDELIYLFIQHSPDHYYEETAYNLVGAPILVKKKEAISRRIKPGLAVTQLLRTISEKTVSEIRKIKFGEKYWKFDRAEAARRRNQEALPTVKNAKTPNEVKCFLHYLQEGQRKSWIKDDAIIEENLQIYRQQHAYRREAIFHHVDQDIANRIDFKFDGVAYDGSKKRDAAEIYRVLTEEKGCSDKKALEIMILIQQRMTTNLRAELEQSFNHAELALEVQQLRTCVCLSATMSDLEIQMHQDFEYRATDPKKLSYSEKPYALFRAEFKLNIPKVPSKLRRASRCFEVLNVTPLTTPPKS